MNDISICKNSYILDEQISVENQFNILNFLKNRVNNKYFSVLSTSWGMMSSFMNIFE